MGDPLNPDLSGFEGGFWATYCFLKLPFSNRLKSGLEPVWEGVGEGVWGTLLTQTYPGLKGDLGLLIVFPKPPQTNGSNPDFRQPLFLWESTRTGCPDRAKHSLGFLPRFVGKENGLFFNFSWFARNRLLGGLEGDKSTSGKRPFSAGPDISTVAERVSSLLAQ